MKKAKKLIKRTLCILFAVVFLFFSVNNSYFCADKMDNVHAEPVTITACITVEALIGLISALAIAGLGCAIINEWDDMDINQLANDVHDWCQDNYDKIDEYIGGTSALKDWIQADTWEVVNGGGGQEPNPSPNKNKVHIPSTWTIAEMIAAGYILSESEENNISVDDKVPITEEMEGIAQAYLLDMLEGFNESQDDLLAKALYERYGNQNNTYFDGEYKHDADGKVLVNFSYKTVGRNGYYNADEYVTWYVQDYIAGLNINPVIVKDGNYWRIYNVFPSGQVIAWGNIGMKNHRKLVLSDGSIIEDSANAVSLFFINDTQFETLQCDIPIFNNRTDALDFVTNGEYSKALNKDKPHNYIDSEDEYGWAGTADLSPLDLFALTSGNPHVMANNQVSIRDINDMIQAIKQKLDEKNPNKPVIYPTPLPGIEPLPEQEPEPEPLPEPEPEPPIPFPTIEDYPRIWEDELPWRIPIHTPVPEPYNPPEEEINPDTGQYNYFGILGLILNLLKSILQAIKDFFAFFVIDVDAIKNHIKDSFESLKELDQFNDLFNIISGFSREITDSYEYPKITIKTPDILIPYVKTPEILLLDFKDWAVQFLMVRQVLQFTIVFGFAMWVVREFRISFSVG